MLRDQSCGKMVGAKVLRSNLAKVSQPQQPQPVQPQPPPQPQQQLTAPGPGPCANNFSAISPITASTPSGLPTSAPPSAPPPPAPRKPERPERESKENVLSPSQALPPGPQPPRPQAVDKKTKARRDKEPKHAPQPQQHEPGAIAPGSASLNRASDKGGPALCSLQLAALHWKFHACCIQVERVTDGDGVLGRSRQGTPSPVGSL